MVPVHAPTLDKPSHWYPFTTKTFILYQESFLKLGKIHPTVFYAPYELLPSIKNVFILLCFFFQFYYTLFHGLERPCMNLGSFSSNSLFVHSLCLSNNSLISQPNLCQNFSHACSIYQNIYYF